MRKDKLVKLHTLFKDKLSDKDEKILQLEKDLETEKAKPQRTEKTVLFEFPTEIKVSNLPEEKEFPTQFEVTNLKDIEIPKPLKEVEVSNLKDIEIEFPKEIEVSNLQKIDQDHKPSWIDGSITAFLQGLTYLLGKVTNKTFKISHDAEHYITPQYVMLINPKTGQPESPTTHVNVQGHGAGGFSSANLLQGITDSLEHYKISDVDDATTTKYYGYVDKGGNWYILREDATLKTYRYTKGATESGGYASAWTARASKTYDYFNTIF